MNNRIEEVKKIEIKNILAKFRAQIETEHYDFHYDAQLVAEEKLCQLFPQPLDDKERVMAIRETTKEHFSMLKP